MNQREIFTKAYLSLIGQMYAEMKQTDTSGGLDDCFDIAEEYAKYAQAISWGWERGIDCINDMDLRFHAPDSGRLETSSTSDLFKPYPKQATEAEKPPLPKP